MSRYPEGFKALGVAYHRNGIGAEGFHVVRFTMREDGKTHRMVGIVFEAEGRVAVLDVDETQAGNIAFAGGNSWRGDVYEHSLRQAIEDDRNDP